MTFPAPRAAVRAIAAPAVAWVFALLLAWMGACAPTARAAPADEVQVHAAYVVNFVRYSRWPAAPGPLTIGVVATPEYAAAMREAATRAGSVDGRAIVVRLLPMATIAPPAAEADRALAAAAADVDVLYVGTTHRSWSRAAVAVAKGRTMLTVGPGRAFLDDGGMIGLYLDRGHVRFDVNAPAIRASAIDVSARLLVLARPAPRG